MARRSRPPAERIEEILLGPARLQALYVAVRLGIPDMVKDGPRSSTLLASSAGVHPEALHRLMRFLVADGVFALAEGGRFGSTPLSDALTMDAPGGYRLQILNMAMRTWDAWRDVLYSVETGQSAFERVHGTTFADDQARNGAWLARERAPALVRAAALIAGDVTESGVVVTAGSGAASLLAALVGKQPGIRGTACDAAAAEEWSLETLAPFGERVRFQPTTPDGCLPDGGDIYVVAGMVRERDDAAAVAFLSRCHGQMAPGARVVVLETLLTEGAAELRHVLLADVELLLTSGGKERTLAEYRALFQRAGFRFEACREGGTGELSAVIGSKGLL